MKYLIINQNTDNYGDDIAAIALTTIIRSIDTSENIRFLYAPRPWSSTVPINGENVSHRYMTTLGGRRAFVEIVKVFLNVRFKFKLKYWNNEFDLLEGDINWADTIIFSPSGANIGIYKDWNALKLMMIIIVFKRKVIFHFNTLGYSGEVIFDYFARKVLSVSQVFVRESKSVKDMATMGVISGFGPDSAFALSPTNNTNLQVLPNATRDIQMVIGLIPTDISWHPEHQQKSTHHSIFSNIVDAILDVARKKNARVMIIPHLYGHMNENVLLDNIKLMLEKKGIDANSVSIAQWVKNAIDYDNAIAQCTSVVSMRYHGIVLAAKNGIPFVALSYENKMREVCRYTKMLDFCIDVENVSVSDLTEKLDGSISRRLEISESLLDISKKLSVMTYYPIYQSWFDQV